VSIEGDFTFDSLALLIYYRSFHHLTISIGAKSLNSSRVRDFFNQSLSFPRKRESRSVLLKTLDARLRGHDGKNSPTAQIVNNQNRSKQYGGDPWILKNCA
jgi:hypothetical protein